MYMYVCEKLTDKVFFSTIPHRKISTTREDHLFQLNSENTIRGLLIIVHCTILFEWVDEWIRE